MTDFKVCFVGYGSIAKRHISNLNTIFTKELKQNIKIDLLRHHNSDESVIGINNIYYDQNELPNDYDAIFITNPTVTHYETLIQLHSKAQNFFIEKPVFTLEQSDYPLPDLSNKMCYVACPLRYTAVIQYLRDFIKHNNVYAVRAISSSYLPDWRPSSDYRKSYSANKELGGGVATDLIHEWDYLQYLFGFPQIVYSSKQKFSKLEINTEDSATYMADYPNMTVELHLDYFGKVTMRELLLITENDTLRCDLVKQRIEFLKSGKSLDFDAERNLYQTEELRHFLNIINRKAVNTNPIELARKVLKLTNGEI